MKLLVLLAIVLLLLSKCNIHTPAERGDYRLIIQNNTSKNVKIVTYQYGYFAYRSHFKTININPFSDYTESFTYEGWKKLELDEGLFYNTDSIVIIYEKEKFKSFTCLERPRDSTNCNESKNPLQFKRSTNIEYILTEEDYQNAEDCDRRCE